MTTDPAERMADAVQQIAQRLAPLETLAHEVHTVTRFLPLASIVLALMVAATGVGTWLMLRDSREGHAALVKMIDQSVANQAEMLRRLHPQP
jgi:hypothetical protein